jgi:hypothetical protein
MPSRSRIGDRRDRVVQARVGVGVDGDLGAPRPAVELVEAGVRGDPVEPRPHRGAPLEAIERSPGLQERLLSGILGVVERAEHAVAVHLQRAAVGVDELGERALVPRARGAHERAFVADRGRHRAHGAWTAPVCRIHRRLGAPTAVYTVTATIEGSTT